MNHINGKAFKINEQEYYACPKDVAIPCDHSTPLGIDWFIPQTRNGVLTGYTRRKSTTKPTTDSVKTISVRNNQTNWYYWVLINDDDTLAEWTDRCAECCGDVTPLDAVTVPTPLLEVSGCLVPEEEVDNVYQYRSVAVALAAGERYRVSGSKNGVAFTPAAPEAGFASLADVKTWTDANWSAYGTFEIDGQTFKFLSDDAKTGSINVVNLTIPVANAGADEANSAGEAATLDGSASTAGTGATITAYKWEKVSGPAGGTVVDDDVVTTASTTDTVAGTYVYKLTVTNNEGVSTSDTKSVVVT